MPELLTALLLAVLLLIFCRRDVASIVQHLRRSV